MKTQISRYLLSSFFNSHLEIILIMLQVFIIHNDLELSVVRISNMNRICQTCIICRSFRCYKSWFSLFERLILSYCDFYNRSLLHFWLCLVAHVCSWYCLICLFRLASEHIVQLGIDIVSEFHPMYLVLFRVFF